MNVGELMCALANLPADMPVVMAQEDEPLGCYGVADVEVTTMWRDNGWSHVEVWDGYTSRGTDETAVAFLSFDEPPRPIVDVELPDVVDAKVVEPHQVRLVACPVCGNDLEVSDTTLPGDQVMCKQCRDVVTLPAPVVRAYGPDWRELPAAEPPPAEEPPQPSAGELGNVGIGTYLAADDVEAAELFAMGWHLLTTDGPEGRALFSRPSPPVTVELHIDQVPTATTSYAELLLVRGGVNGELGALLTPAVVCADCRAKPVAGQDWTVQLAVDVHAAAWRHKGGCP